MPKKKVGKSHFDAESEIELIKQRLTALESRPVYINQPCTLPHYPSQVSNTWPAPHYHGTGEPCWNNPCCW